MSATWVSGVIAAVALVAEPPINASRHVSLNNHGKVENYYGVPVSLRIKDVARLRLPYKEGTEESEGFELRTATIQAADGVEVVAVFGAKGDALELKTTSAMAVDPRGVRVGDALKRAKELWPEGKLFFGMNTHDQRYAVFANGTNVTLRFTTDYMGPDATKMFVREIRITDFVVPTAL